MRKGPLYFWHPRPIGHRLCAEGARTLFSGICSKERGSISTKPLTHEADLQDGPGLGAYSVCRRPKEQHCSDGIHPHSVGDLLPRSSSGLVAEMHCQVDADLLPICTAMIQDATKRVTKSL